MALEVKFDHGGQSSFYNILSWDKKNIGNNYDKDKFKLNFVRTLWIMEVANFEIRCWKLLIELTLSYTCAGAKNNFRIDKWLYLRLLLKRKDKQERQLFIFEIL